MRGIHLAHRVFCSGILIARACDSSRKTQAQTLVLGGFYRGLFGDFLGTHDPRASFVDAAGRR